VGARDDGGAGARDDGGAGARDDGGAGARDDGGAGARDDGGAGARDDGGAGARDDALEEGEDGGRVRLSAACACARQDRPPADQPGPRAPTPPACPGLCRRTAGAGGRTRAAGAKDTRSTRAHAGRRCSHRSCVGALVPPPAAGGTNAVVVQVRESSNSIFRPSRAQVQAFSRRLEEGLEGAASNCVLPPGAGCPA
jgi:hypothetical protein